MILNQEEINVKGIEININKSKYINQVILFLLTLKKTHGKDSQFKRKGSKRFNKR